MKILWIALACIWVSGCAVLPLHDVGRAVNQLEDGQEETGLASLHYLSQKGYAEADQALAAYFSRQSDYATVAKAEPIFDRLDLQSHRVDRLYSRWLEKMARFDPGFIEQAHAKLQKQAGLNENNTIRLFRFEQRYASQLGKRFDTETITAFVEKHQLQGLSLIRVIDALDDPQAYYAQVARACQSAPSEALYYCHRIHLRQAKWHAPADLDALAESMVSDVVSEELTPSQFDSLLKMVLTARIGEPNVNLAYQMYRDAGLDNPPLFLAIARYDVTERRNFTLSELESRLTALLEAGHAEAGLLLGTLYTYAKRTPRDPWKAEAYFTRALPLAEAEYRLGNLYLSGRLGEQQKQKGVNLLVSAARQGYVRAYSDLVDVFLGAPGVKPNPLFAHVFSEVASELGVTLSASQQLALQTLELNQAQYKQAKQLVGEELKATQAGESDVARLARVARRK